MNYKITALAVITATVSFLASCAGSDADVQQYDDAVITSFSLGTVRCMRTMKKSDGGDSTYTYTYSAASFPMSIDQVNGRIYNLDSLVVGTSVNKVLTTISVKNNGAVYLRTPDTEDTWTYYNSSDSLDFSFPRTVRVISNNGATKRDYTVEVNVHKEDGDAFTWQPVVSEDLDVQFNYVSSAYSAGKMYILFTGKDAGDNAIHYLYSSADGVDWSDAPTLPSAITAADSVIVAAHNNLYMMAGNTLYRSQDGALTWSPVSVSGMTIRNLCGGDGSYLYAVSTANELYSMKNDGNMTFEKEVLEGGTYYDVTGKLPYGDVNVLSMAVKTNEDLHRYIMVGNSQNAADTTAVVWNKIDDVTTAQPWTYTMFAWNNKDYTLPAMHSLTAVYYGDGIVAMGGSSKHSKAKSPYSCLYYSPDFGATWHTNSRMELPSGYDATKVKAVKLLTDGKMLYYVVLSSKDNNKTEVKVWKAKQNKLSWTTNKTLFE